MSAPCSGSTLMAGSCKVRATMLATLPAFLIPPLMSSCARVDDSPLGHKRTFAVSLDHLGKWCARRSSNMRLPHVGQAGRIKTLGGLAVIVAILIPTNKQKPVTPLNFD